MRYLILLILFVSCSKSSNEVERYLKLHGNCDRVIDHGYSFFGCSKNDNFSNSFTCYKKGTAIDGVLCSGLFKGKTIRWD